MTSRMMMGVLAYALAINLLSYAAMVLDKAKAESRSRRIPEATLLNLALIGGSVGTVLAQQTIRHKTELITKRGQSGFEAVAAGGRQRSACRPGRHG